MTGVWAAVVAAAVAWLLACRDRPCRFVAKPLASVAFVAVGLSRFDGGTELWVLAGLVLGAVGDIALLGSSDRAFLAGLGSFLAGHLCYVVAFSLGDRSWAVPGTVAATVLGVMVWRWLAPNLPDAMRVPVWVYTAVICLMVALGLSASGSRPVAALGAVLFAASDISVARDRFVVPARLNSTWGLPTYYLAQVLIAIGLT